MSNRQFQILVGAVVLLAAALALARWNSTRSQDPFEQPFEMSSIKASEIDKVTVDSAGKITTLLRKGKGWTVDGSTADTTTVDKFFKAVSGTSFADVVSTNPSNYASFGVERTGRKVAFWVDKEKKAELIVGNPAQSLQTFYARSASSKEVWTMTGDLPSVLPAAPDAWKAKR